MNRGALRALADNRRLLGKLLVVVAAMFGFGYALVPMYRAICTALGINVLSLSELLTSSGLAGARERKASTQIDYSRKVTIEFDANARGPWDFKPALRSIELHPGEMATVMYEFRNVQDRTMAAQAIPSYAPQQAGAHFNKIECFCFTEQTLQPGQSIEMPVSFFIDPKIAQDRDTSQLANLTLSYVFYPVARTAASKPQAGGG